MRVRLRFARARAFSLCAQLANTEEFVGLDSGAAATVVGDEMVQAVRAADPKPNASYRLADDSAILSKGYKYFIGVTEEGFNIALKASITDVDRPLLRVAHVVHNGVWSFSPPMAATSITLRPRRVWPWSREEDASL